MKKIIIYSICLFGGQFAHAQDSLDVYIASSQKETNLPLKKMIIPAGLIVTGAVLKIPAVENSLQNSAGRLFGRNFNNKTDDYIQYVPLAGLFSGRLLWFQTEHSYAEIGTNMALSAFITGSITLAAKKGFAAERPDGSAKNAYPSGHSALSFSLATMQFLEYKNSNIYYASSGFLFASATAVMRVANNRHWTGDVFTGAGIGMAASIFTYYWNPLSKMNLMRASSKKVSLTGFPMVDQNKYGIGLVMNIHPPEIH